MAIGLDVDAVHASQDVAVPVAFLITEIVELAMACDPGGTIEIRLRGIEDSLRALLEVRSTALRECDELAARLELRYGRVIEGLSRQLRSKIRYEAESGCYTIEIAIAS